MGGCLTLQYKNIIDISPTISERLAVFPGDEPFSRNESCKLTDGAPYTLSAITTTLHIGSHADAPSHYALNGESIAERNLEIYLGKCQVIRVVKHPHDQRIRPSDIADRTILAPRVLFATESYQAETWTDTFTSLSPDLIEFLHERNVILVGIDTPSVDPAASKKLEAHAALHRCNVSVLEGLVLRHVDEGLYDLIALPLKIENGESSPVRAILLSIE